VYLGNVGEEEAPEAELRERFDGPSPVNRIHGAIELDGNRPTGTPRASQAGIDAALDDIMAALWGL
jgi:hypothetical protein